MNFGLPTTVNVRGVDWPVRYDFRAVLEICIALSDPELDGVEKATVALNIFYPNFAEMPREYDQAALDECMAFINGGEAEKPKKNNPVLIDWEQDYKHIVPAVNRILGQEVRAIPYDAEHNTGGLHWWTFLGAYMEIGDCLFSQIVRIRRKKAFGEKLEKTEQKWLRENRDLVELKNKYTQSEKELLAAFGIK